MKIFRVVRESRVFFKSCLPSLVTIQDFDLVIEIGYHQESGTELNLRRLHLLGIASYATVQRRIKRLRQLRMIDHTRAPGDGRSVELRLSREAMRVFARYEKALAKAIST